VPSATNLYIARQDPYAWLRDRDNPAVTAFLEAENRRTAEVMKDTEPLQEALYDEILGRIKETDLSVPVRRGPYFYYFRTGKGKQYAIYCRKRGSLNAPEEIYLDANELASGHNYFRLGVLEPSPNHDLLAYSTDVAGDEVYTMRVKDLRTGELLPDIITGASAGAEWDSAGRTVFYTTLDEAKRPDKLWRRTLGEPEPHLIYFEPDERFELRLGKSKSGEFVLLELASHATSEYRYLRASDPAGDLRVLFPRRQDIEYEVTHNGDSFYVRINDTGRNFRLIKVPVNAPEEIIELRPASEQVYIESIDAFREHLLIVEREGGLRRLAIESLATGATHRIEFSEPAYSVWPMDNFEYDTRVLRFGYTSMITPVSVFDYDMETRSRELKKQQEVPGGYDASQYRSERIFATAPDGVQVPISLVYRKSTVLDGSAPALLYGYGAYGATIDASFAADRLSLLDRGFVFAIAHVRGGAEMGRHWYDDGKLMRKKNTFTDFIACAECLIARGYTSSRRLAIVGGSAGGLLIGAVLNMRPELFHAAIAKVPFVDTLNTMLDPTLPLTISEYEEWGNPADPAYYEYIGSYSPYENVRPARYPHLLATAGLNDPRVSYWEAAKWVARIRETAVDGPMLLLKTNMGAGHFGASGRYERIRETAFEYAFLLKANEVEI
jgi:oligopeptidase B